MSHVAIIGSGLIGRAWALVFARGGWDVAMTDTSASVLSSLKSQLDDDCALLEKHGLCESRQALLARIDFTDCIEQAVQNADFAQENGPENVDIKRAIFSELDEHAPPHAILASSTSAIVASRFTESLAGRGRCVVGHPVNPPHLVPLVEVCGAPWTEQATLEAAREVYASVGQVPIRVNSETDGFVLNRLQGALLAEAFRLVRDGVVSPEDLDHTLKDGLGLRWALMGPFETIELNAPGGIADYLRRYTGFYQRLADDPPTSDVFGHDVQEAIVQAWQYPSDESRLARLTQQRNEKLAALRVHKQAAKSSVGQETSIG